jgi:PKD repeat protein
MNVDGSGVVRLTNAIGSIGRPAWSPNGAKIAFDCEVETGNRDICSITIDGTGFLRLTTYPAADFGAAWSPDGSKIAFSTFAGGADVYVLAMMNPDGTGATLVGDFTMGSRPSWSPDGNQIVYSTAPYSWLGWYSIERINTDGTGYASIGSGFDAVWAPAIAAPPGPAAALSPPSLQFGTQSVGTTGSPQSIRLINYGSSELVFSIVASGDFAQANTCNGTVPPRAHYCTINVMFTPTAAGSRGGAVTITDNAPGSPRVVTLSGVGDLPPIASFTSNCIGLTCYFDGSGSADPDGWIVNRLFSFGDGSAGGDSHTYAVSGTYTVTLTVTDNAGGTGAQSTSVTVPAGSMHVGDLDGTKASQQNTWTATVTVTVEDSSHSRLANATVNGSWSGGGTSSCTTNASGQCAVSKSGIRRNTGSATFAVSGVTQALLPYNSTDNHDPDGDSSGTIITVMRP